MKITKLLTPFNFKTGNNKSNKFIVIHYIGAFGGAKANAEYYASKYIGASAHYFVGFDGEVYQSVEDKNIAWHSGAENYKHADCRNANSIGIEMCVRKKNTASKNAEDRDWYFENTTVKTTIELTKELMKKYNIPAGNVIRHYDVTGKTCPNPYVYNHTDHTWAAFKAALTGTVTEKPESNPADKEIEKEKPADIKGYEITTTCDALNIRSGAGANYKVTGCIREPEGKKNKYTIIEEKNGWGKLKSGKGWISLKYIKKIGSSITSTPGYEINTTCDALNIRSGAGTSYKVEGCIRELEGKKNKYTIVEEKNGWGRLKSGKGWISLSYTKKVS